MEDVADETLGAATDDGFRPFRFIGGIFEDALSVCRGGSIIVIDVGEAR